MSDWRKVEIGNTWNYKELGKGAKLVGVYTGKEEHVGENDSNVYSFEVEGGDVMSVWGTTLLDMRLKNIKEGEEVKIVYLGEEKSMKRTGKTYHNFEVYHRAVDFTEVDTNEDIPLPENE
jgi:hypothetical protein